MIKLIHILRQDESKVARMVADFLRKKYRYYFQVKVYGNGDKTTATEIFTADKSADIKGRWRI